MHDPAGTWRLTGSPHWRATTTAEDGTPVDGRGASPEEAVGAAVLAAWRAGLVVVVAAANLAEDTAST